MAAKLFKNQSNVRARALLVGQRLNIKAFDASPRLATAPLVVKAGAERYAALFRYGAVVLFNMDPVEEVSFLSDLEVVIVDSLERPESEEIEIVINPKETDRIEGGQILSSDCTVEHLQAIGDILAKSVALSFYEQNIARSFDRIEPMAAELEKRGRTGHKTKELLSHIGHTLMIQSKMIGRVEIVEKPDFLWENAKLERLYMRLADEFELYDRHMALKDKLELIHQTAETLLGLLHEKRALHLEWYILLLILIEVVMSMTDRALLLFH